MILRTIIITICAALVSIPVTAYYWRGPLVVEGLVLGLVIAVLSFLLLTKIVVKSSHTQYPPETPNSGGAGAAKTVALLIGKMLLTFGVVGAAFLFWDIPAIAFLIGYVNLPVAIFVSGLFEYRN